jgi:hypothetical protein
MEFRGSNRPLSATPNTSTLITPALKVDTRYFSSSKEYYLSMKENQLFPGGLRTGAA